MRPSLLFGVLVFLLAPAAAHAQLGVYEDWSGTGIRGDRWRGGEDAIVFSVGGLEVSRAIANNMTFGRELTMRLRAQSSSISDPRAGFNMMHLTNPAAVDALDVSFRVSAFKVTQTQKAAKPGCPFGAGTNDPSGFDAVVMMTKFNDGSSLGAGDRTGDITVLFTARYNTDFLGFDLTGFMLRCDDSRCFSASPVLGSKFQPAGTVAKNVPFRLGLADNVAGNEFQVTFNGAVVATVDYTGLPVAPAAVNDASFGVRVNTGDCWVGSPTPNMFADITVKAGDVLTNAGAVIP